jgi:hypothetical protein
MDAAENKYTAAIIVDYTDFDENDCTVCFKNITVQVYENFFVINSDQEATSRPTGWIFTDFPATYPIRRKYRVLGKCSTLIFNKFGYESIIEAVGPVQVHLEEKKIYYFDKLSVVPKLSNINCTSMRIRPFQNIKPF